MALATRCPNCSALFRVGADQLKSRGGMVRCGSCRHVFNAIGCLDYMEPRRAAAAEPLARVGVVQPPRAGAARDTGSGAGAPGAVAQTGKSPAPAVPAGRAAANSTAGSAAPSAASAAAASAPPPSSSSSRPASAPARTGTPVPAAPARREPESARGSERAERRETSVATGVRRRSSDALPMRFAPASDADREPGDGEGALTLIAQPSNTEPGSDMPPAPSFDHLFLPAAGARAAGDTGWDDERAMEPAFLRPRAPLENPSVRLAMRVACAVMVPALLIQAALVYRADAVVHFPELRPALSALCVPLSCTVPFPMRPDLLAVVSSDLERLPGSGTLELDAVVRNRAAYPLAIPAMELTITDSLNQPVARKVFQPADYLGMHGAGIDPAGQNIAPGADLSIRLLFDLPGVNAAGFVAYPFYP